MQRLETKSRSVPICTDYSWLDYTQAIKKTFVMSLFLDNFSHDGCKSTIYELRKSVINSRRNPTLKKSFIFGKHFALIPIYRFLLLRFKV